LTIKSTSPAFRPIRILADDPACLTPVDATSSRFRITPVTECSSHSKLVFCMPVNIQLSKNCS
jgi:hypothetical protein